MVVNDETALGIMWELQQNGIRIPDDISIVGIGGIPASKYSYPPLTTIVLPCMHWGKRLADILLINWITVLKRLMILNFRPWNWLKESQ